MTPDPSPLDQPAGPLPCYEVYALRYGHRPARRTEHFLGGDPHDEPMDMDYFVWAVVDPSVPAGSPGRLCCPARRPGTPPGSRAPRWG